MVRRVVEGSLADWLGERSPAARKLLGFVDVVKKNYLPHIVEVLFSHLSPHLIAKTDIFQHLSFAIGLEH